MGQVAGTAPSTGGAGHRQSGAMRRVPGGSLMHAGAATVLLVAVTSCGVTRGDDSRDLLMIIPNSPGGGYDQTGRAAVKVMEDDDITGGSFTVDNVIGAGGAGAMTSLIGKAGDEHTMMTVGLGVVGAVGCSCGRPGSGSRMSYHDASERYRTDGIGS